MNHSSLEGELLQPDDPRGYHLSLDKQRLAKALSYWSDTVFEVPGLGWRFGLDPIIGLIPVAGDLASALISIYILALATEMRMPRATVLRMGLNVAVDYFVGAIPLVGNIFDFAWKANYRNMQLLERQLALPPERRQRASIWDWLILVGIVAALSALFVASIAMAILLASWVASLFTR